MSATLDRRNRAGIDAVDAPETIFALDEMVVGILAAADAAVDYEAAYRRLHAEVGRTADRNKGETDLMYLGPVDRRAAVRRIVDAALGRVAAVEADGGTDEGSGG